MHGRGRHAAKLDTSTESAVRERDADRLADDDARTRRQPTARP